MVAPTVFKGHDGPKWWANQCQLPQRGNRVRKTAHAEALDQRVKTVGGEFERLSVRVQYGRWWGRFPVRIARSHHLPFRLQRGITGNTMCDG